MGAFCKGGFVPEEEGKKSKVFFAETAITLHSPCQKGHGVFRLETSTVQLQHRSTQLYVLTCLSYHRLCWWGKQADSVCGL